MAAKNKNSETQNPETIDILDKVKESAYFQWLIEKRGVLPYLFVGVVITIALSYKFLSGKTTQAETNFILAEHYFNKLNRTLSEPEGTSTLPSLEKLKEITDAYPELQSRYDGLIAQLLLAKGETVEANPYALRSIQRASRDELPSYPAFSRTTLTIANGNYTLALSEAKELKAQMVKQIQEKRFGSALFAYNLLRIATLEQKAGTPAEELLSWEELEKYADQAENASISEAFAALNEQLKQGEFTLMQYIKARKKNLQSSSR